MPLEQVNSVLTKTHTQSKQKVQEKLCTLGIYSDYLILMLTIKRKYHLYFT